MRGSASLRDNSWGSMHSDPPASSQAGAGGNARDGGVSGAGDGAAGGLLERVRPLLPLIADAAEETERTRRLAPAVLAALHDLGLFRMLMPRSLGGHEADPLTFARVIEAVGAAEASTAWCLCQNSVCAVVSAYLAPEVARHIFGARDAVLAWGPGPAKAVATDGGYRVTGSWTCASGGRHATWLGGYCPIVEADGTPRRANGAPAGRTMLFPAVSATMSDVWQVIGLRGTGSDSFAVTDLFVPQQHTVARNDQRERREPGPLYCFSTDNLYSCGFGSLALGVARSMLDDFLRLAKEKTPRGYASPLRDNAETQVDVARAEAQLRSARVFLHGSIADIWAEVQRTGEMTMEHRMAMRLAATFAIRQARDVAGATYDAAGATAIFATQPFERRFRDLNTVAQQLQGRKAHFQTVGRYLLGLDYDTSWL